MSEPTSRPRRFRQIACIILLITLALPFSRCSGTSTAVATGPNPPAAASAPLPPDPWYSAVIGKRGPSPNTYTYGYEIFLNSWEVPQQFDLVLLIPGRMFYVWPFVALFSIRWMRVRAARVGFYLAELVLSIGAMWWALVAVNTALSGFYLAITALTLYAAAAVWDIVLETKAWRREKRAGYGGDTASS
jgi:hypothetical protein